MDPNMLKMMMMQGGGMEAYSWPASCDGCRNRIQGIRYKCLTRGNYDFCAQCFEIRDRKGMSSHNWSKMTNPALPAETITERVEKYRWPANCDGCRSGIHGNRYKCLTRNNFDFCEDCFELRSSKDMSNHNWRKMTNPKFPEVIINERESEERKKQDKDQYRWPANCDGCRSGIRGTRYKCKTRSNYDFCEDCFEERNSKGMANHDWTKMTHPNVPNEDFFERTKPEEKASPVIEKYSWSANCDGCRSGIKGNRYKCLTRNNFDFCAQCFETRSSKGMLNHNWLKMVNPQESSVINDREEVEVISTYSWPASCDGCRGKIVGLRYKCDTRRNYDLCDSCFKKRANLGMGQHNWKKMVDLKAPSEDIKEKPAESVTHSASCDGCRSRIKGVRYKCVSRTNYDFCSDCFQNREKKGMAGHNWEKMVELNKVSEVIREQPEQQPNVPSINPMFAMMQQQQAQMMSQQQMYLQQQQQNPMMMALNHQQQQQQNQQQQVEQLSGDAKEFSKEIQSLIDCAKKIEKEKSHRGECRIGFCHYLPKLGYQSSMMSMERGNEYLQCSQLCDKILKYMEEKGRELNNPSFYPNIEQTKEEVRSLSRDCIAKHAKKSINGFLSGLWDERKKKEYWTQLQRFPGAQEYCRKRVIEMKYSAYENRMFALPEDKRFVLPTNVPPSALPVFNDSVEDYEEPFEMIRPSDPSVPLRTLPEELDEDSNNRRVWTDFRKRHTSKIVFSKSPIDVNENSDDKITNSFVYGRDEIHGRAIWAHAIRHFAFAKDKRTGEWIYPAEQFKNKTHFNREDFYAEFYFHLYVNGNKMIVKGTPFGEIMRMDQRGDEDRGCNFYKKTQSCRLYVSLTDGKKTKWDIFDGHLSYAQKFNSVFKTLPAGQKHRIKIEMSYRLKVLDESLDADTPLFPTRDTLLSHPICAGEFELEIPQNVPDLPNPFPVYSCTVSNGRSIVEQVKNLLRESGEWGRRRDKKEELIYCIAEGELYPLYEEYWDKLNQCRARYVKQFGLEIKAVFYRNPQNGWDHEHCRIFKLAAYNPETPVGVDQEWKMGEKLLLPRFGVGGSTDVGCEYVPDEIWRNSKVRRCDREMADYYKDLKPEDLKYLGRKY